MNCSIGARDINKVNRQGDSRQMCEQDRTFGGERVEKNM